tara:strand:- start:8296 stop:9411 length:1116 start_codon:yes stop_codon:yes gene_type:complete
MYHILTGKQRSLVFPVMCNSRVKMDYSNNIPDIEGTPSDTTDDTGFGIWGHTGTFTFESVITPYEINGMVFSTAHPDTKSSHKIMPNGRTSDSLSNLYLSTTARLTHEMMIFYNTNFQVSLVNDTDHLYGQPAEYKIRVRLKLGTTTDTYTTGTAISATEGKMLVFDDLGSDRAGFDKSGRLKFRQATTGVIHSHSLNTLSVVSNTQFVDVNAQEVFYRSGFDFLSLGVITNISGSTITITNPNNVSLSAGTPIYLKAYSLPNYINDSFHIACVFEELSKTLNIYLNGKLLSTNTHTDSGAFTFDRSDIYLGSNGSDSTGAGSATTNKQFMGEMHELAITKAQRKRFPYVLNLLPNYDDTLLYLRFEEVDL